MTEKSQVEPLLRTLLEAHEAAFALREHEVSFHVLSAAAHAAEALEELAALGRIERRARDELAWIDEHDPDHRHSSRSAQARGHRSIFEQLTVTSAGMRKRIEADRQIRATRASMQ